MNDKEKYSLLNKYEDELYSKNKFNVLGIDEVGRGPVAGDVVVGGVILDKDKPIYGLDDSKKISEKKRIELDKEIKEKCKIYKTVSVSCDEIDEIGISNAIRLGVSKLISEVQKKIQIDYILIDYMKIDLHIDHLILKKGDSKSNSIAAASIIAKVFRDNNMIKLGSTFLEYGFENHKGYGTKKHIEAIKEFGIIDKVHRKSFEPIKSLLKEGKDD